MASIVVVGGSTDLALVHWRDAGRHDRARTARWRATLGLAPSQPPEHTPVPMPVAMAAGAVDADVWTRTTRAMQLLDPPGAVFDDHALADRIRELDPPAPPPPACRADLVAAVDAGATTSWSPRHQWWDPIGHHGY